MEPSFVIKQTIAEDGDSLNRVDEVWSNGNNTVRYTYRENHQKINDDGKAHNGNYGALFVALGFGLIIGAILAPSVITAIVSGVLAIVGAILG